jgi:hypothetical protein
MTQAEEQFHASCDKLEQLIAEINEGLRRAAARLDAERAEIEHLEAMQSTTDLMRSLFKPFGSVA